VLLPEANWFFFNPDDRATGRNCTVNEDQNPEEDGCVEFLLEQV
jgi:hypothetical protein